jgi:hypothetical protein
MAITQQQASNRNLSGYQPAYLGYAITIELHISDYFSLTFSTRFSSVEAGVSTTFSPSKIPVARAFFSTNLLAQQ